MIYTAIELKEKLKFFDGKFLDNGCSGYVLKPRFLRDKKTKFNPHKVQIDSNPLTLTIRVRLLLPFFQL